jgi:hypothetical protein
MARRDLRRAAIGAALAAPIAALAYPSPASAHALVSRQDLPIPAWLFAWGASVVLIASFFALSVLWKKPRFESEDWRPLGNGEGQTNAALRVVFEVAAGAAAVFLLGLTIWSGLHGTVAPDRNFSLTFVFVTFWLGFAVLSVALGDVFPPFSPWRAIGRSVGGIFKAISGQRPLHLDYPEWLGRWPAAVGLVAFVFLEVVYGEGSISGGLTPHDTAVAALAYSVFTLAMMSLFGTEEWSRKGETFSVYFNMFSQLSIFEMRDGRLGRRKLFSGAAHWATIPGSIAVVVASIATTSFDGAQEGALKDPIASTFGRLSKTSLSLPNALRATDLIYLVLCVIGVAALFLIGVQGMRTIRNAPPVKKLRQGFAHTLIPIAFAYLVAHYFSLFVFQEQAQFTYLLTHPLGSTTGSIDYRVISVNSIWYVQVAALVIGHVCGLAMAHDRATAYWGDYKQASRSQLWMLAVMVGFTCFGLYLLSQANQ